MNNLQTMFSTQSRKAYVATLIAAIGAATIAADGGFTVTEWLTIAGVALVAFQGTYWTSNAQDSTQAVDSLPGGSGGTLATNSPTTIHRPTLS